MMKPCPVDCSLYSIRSQLIAHFHGSKKLHTFIEIDLTLLFCCTGLKLEEFLIKCDYILTVFLMPKRCNHFSDPNRAYGG